MDSKFPTGRRDGDLSQKMFPKCSTMDSNWQLTRELSSTRIWNLEGSYCCPGLHQ